MISSTTPFAALRLPRPLAALALALAATLALAPGAAAQSGSFAEEAEVRVIEIPVQVTTRDGEPIRGLTADDFEVRIGRDRQELVGFEVIDLATVAPSQAAELAPTARRHFLFLFDLTFSDPIAIFRARDMARDLVAEALHPSDVAAVATHSLAHGPQLVLGFTSDRDEIERAIATLGAPKLVDQRADPLGLVLSPATAFSSADLFNENPVEMGARTEGRGPGQSAAASAVIEHLREMSRLVERADRRYQGQRVEAMARGMADLGKLLAGIEARKHVVYFSEGFDDRLLVGEQLDAQANIERNLDIEFGEVQNIDSNQVFGQSGVQNEIEAMLEDFRRANAAIHTVDIGGLRAANDVQNQRTGKNVLNNFARSTGGIFYDNYNQLDQAVDKLIEATSVTYLLAIQPTDLDRDPDKFHKLRVELKNAPRGTEVSHRPGFYVLPPAADTPMGRRLSTAELILGGEKGGSLDAAAFAAPIRVAGEPAYVPILVEVPGERLLAGFGGQQLPLELYAYAVDANGGFVDFFTQIVTLDLEKVRPAIEAKGIKFYGHVDLPPGDYSLRVLVRNPATGVYALDVVPVEVDAGGASFALLPPIFPEEGGEWLILRESENQRQEREVAYPFISADGAYVPAARPRLTPGEPARLYLRGYGFGSQAPQVAALVEGEDGTRHTSPRLALEQYTLLPEDMGHQLVAAFDPVGLAAGRYRLTVTVTDADTGRSDTRTTTFEVAPGAAAAAAPSGATR